MRGGTLHNQRLIDPLQVAFESIGAMTATEVAVQVSPGRQGFIDLVAQADGRRIAVEAELSGKRVANDMAKAAALEAAELWIVVPNPRVARQVLSKLQQLGAGKDRSIFVLTQAQAIARVTSCFPLFSGAIPLRKTIRGGKQLPSSPCRGNPHERSY